MVEENNRHISKSNHIIDQWQLIWTKTDTLLGKLVHLY